MTAVGNTERQVMARESIAGKYTVSFSEAGDVVVAGPGTTRHTRVRALIDDLGISLAFGTLLPPHLADLLDIAAAAYIADRLCVRRPRTAHRSQLDELWQRRLTIRVPLRNPDAWLSRRRARLETLLGFLTDDAWTLELTAEQPKRRLSETQTSLLSGFPTTDASAALLSGGLDSLAGILTELVGHPARTIIAFSARTNRRIGTYQRAQVQALNSQLGQRIRHVPVAIKLTGRQHGAYDREEPSQRTRGFVFQVFGAVTAAAAGVNVLHVYENGIGALNLPYSATQLGAQATRATNPLTTALASDLLTDVIGQPFRVVLPHQFATKADMCSVFADPATKRLIELSISCDNFPQRLVGKPQCGVCPSCLFSRQSLFSAGLRSADPSGRFRHDIYALEDVDRGNHAYYCRVMALQASALSLAVETDNPWQALVRQHPILLEVASDRVARTGIDPSADIVSLYRRYCAEWNDFWSEVGPTARGAA